MGNCEISKDILHSCDNPPVAGQRDRIIIIPRRLITDTDFNNTYSNIIEDITIAAGGRAYEYVGTSKLLKSDKGMISDDNGIRYRHRIPFIVYGNTPIIKAELEALVKENMGVVAILQQNYKGTSGNSEFEVFGINAGLRVTLLEDTDGRNQYNIELASVEGCEEPRLPFNFFDTDTATTKAKIEALLVTVPSV